MTRSVYAPAKINLWLRVFTPDHTGYHPLNTLFCAIDLHDRLTLSLRGDDIQLEVHGPDVGPVSANLAARAALEYCHALGVRPGVHIVLEKNIPAGAGLGGGSSDAAAVLRALQDLHDHRLPEQDVLAIAARLGSDVPFFLCGSPFALAGGRGELLQPIPMLPQRDVVVIVPDFPIATRAAYGWLDDEGSFRHDAAAPAVPSSWEDVRAAACNDFEPVLFQRYHELQHARAALVEAGAAIALVSGSGSALFGIFDDSRAAAETLKKRLPTARIVSARTLTDELI